MKIYLCLFLMVFLGKAGLFAQMAGAAKPSMERFGNLDFMAPVGWQAVERADLLILVPWGTTPESTAVSITMFPPTPRGQQSLSQWMKAMLRTIRMGYRIVKTEEPTAAASAPGAASLMMTELLADPTGSGVVYQFYFAIATAGEGQMIMYSASNPKDFERGARTVNAMIESLSLRKKEPLRPNRRPAETKKAAPLGRVVI